MSEGVWVDSLPELDEVPEGVKRDRWGRPLLLRRGGAAREAYTRASSLADFIISKYGLHKWEMRKLTKGMADREDLCALIAALPPLVDSDKLDRAVKKELDRVANEAMRHAGRDLKADYGTAMHRFTEPGPHGAVPARMRSDLESYRVKRRGITELMSECFTACDETRSAGTFDKFVHIPGIKGAVVDDLKTGRVNPIAIAVQLGGYANGDLYDYRTDERPEWPDTVNRDVALFTHTPRGEGQTYLHLVNIELGYKWAKHAAETRDLQQAPIADILQPLTPDAIARARRIELRGQIVFAETEQTIVNMWAANQDIWDDTLTLIASQQSQRVRAIIEKGVPS